GRHERRRVHFLVPVLDKIIQKLAPNFRACQGHDAWVMLQFDSSIHDKLSSRAHHPRTVIRAHRLSLSSRVSATELARERESGDLAFHIRTTQVQTRTPSRTSV